MIGNESPRHSRLLVVDDEEPLLQIFVEFFEGREFQIEIARSAEEAIERLAGAGFDLVVTDLNLPGQDGLAVLRAAKATDQDTEVIMLTGNASTLTAIDAMRQGAYDYVLKPFDLYEMESTIMRALERRRLLEENERYVTSIQQANQELLENQQQLKRHRDELSRLVDEATRRIRSLYEVGKEITSSLHLERALRLILEKSAGLTGASQGMLFLLDETSGELVPRECEGLVHDSPEFHRLAGALGTLNSRATVLRVPVRERMTGEEGLVREALVVPLLQEGSASGTIAVFKSNGSFSGDDSDLLVGLASFASIAIHNARVFEKIRDLEKLKSEFVAVVSHEVRTPLTAIKGTLEILSDQKYFQFAPNQIELLQICSANVSRLEVLINDILDFSKLESSRLSTHFASIRLETVVENVITHIGNLAAKKGVTIEKVVAPGLPAAEADELRLSQVLNNLLSNAIKFSPDGAIIRVEVADQDGGLLVRIQDRGIGISAEDVPKLFTKFRQLDSSSTRKVGGTGLGLAISKGIIDEHHGRIWVESVAGEGSCFCFWIPCRRSAELEIDQGDLADRSAA
ncbi:MAG: response regulator [Candidatus Eisenbacteria bacterium]|nr:response regulator [Candidatus Eisenbacteria bacterium]